MAFYNNIYNFFARPLRALFRVKVTGRENIPHGRGCILCANHTSMLDVLALSAALDRQVRYMAKKELFRIPLIGGLIKALGAYPVNRGAADVTSIRKTISLCEEGELVGMFPQGTRHPKVDPRTTEIKHGVGLVAFRAKCDIVPVFIKTKHNKVHFFGKTELIVGEVIPYDELGFTDGGSKEYNAAAEKVFDRICTLGENSDKTGDRNAD